jgi:hypothetical protein
MRGCWSFAVVVAIAIAIAVATAGSLHPAQEARAVAPVQVTLALNSDGPSLSVAHGAFVVTLEM